MFFIIFILLFVNIIKKFIHQQILYNFYILILLHKFYKIFIYLSLIAAQHSLYSILGTTVCTHTGFLHMRNLCDYHTLDSDEYVADRYAKQ